ncbi:TIGR04222 domain-containing membrane protein [Nonomuraea sp. NPDC049714]|uniref:TIGR04222 domain-containing membrane protein n=1 Tax=Nonomuraea sp. NPDC049714 TaxID=3364357 RepID=UPI0037AC2196
MGVLVTLILVCAVLIAAVIATTSSLKSRYARMRGAVDAGTRELGAYEVAYLAGGALRAVNTAIAVLTRAGLLRVSRGGLLHPVAGAARPGDDLERAVLAAAGSGASAHEVRHEVGKGQEMTAIHHQLIALGLIAPEEATGTVRSRLRRLALLSVLCLILVPVTLLCVLYLPEADTMAGAVLAVGAIALVVTGISGLSTYVRLRRALRSLVTYAGQERLSRAKSTHRPGAPAATVSDISMPVALYGLSAMGDPETEAELNARDNAVPPGGSCAGGTCGGSHDTTQSFGGGDFVGSSGTSSSGGSGSHSASSSSCGGGGSSCGGGGGCGGGCGGG